MRNGTLLAVLLSTTAVVLSYDCVAEELKHCTPPNYTFLSFPRTYSDISSMSSGGGTGFLIREPFTQLIFTKLSVNSIPLPPPSYHSFRRFHSIDIDSFLRDLQSSRLITSPPTSLGSLLIAYNTTLSTLLDKHAPVTSNH